jgi:hypothetical protein
MLGAVRKHLFVLLFIAAICAGITYLFSLAGNQMAPRVGLGAAPAESRIVLHLDVPALRASPLWTTFVDGDDAGLARVTAACGFDPIERVQTLALFVMPGQRPFDRLGFIARGELPSDRLVRCIEQIVTEDGGGVRQVVIEGLTAIASENGPNRAAFLDSGGIVAGEESVVEAAIHVDRGDAPSAQSDEVLASLWRKIESRTDFLVVAHLPTNWRQWLGRIGQVIDIEGIDQANALGLGATLRNGLGLTLAIQTNDAASSAQLATAAREHLDTLMRHPILALSGISNALSGIAIETQQRDIVARLDLDQAQLGSIIDFARIALRGQRDAAMRRSPTLPSLPSDEELHPGQ